MARVIDPAELEGDDLFNWYMRSPADVEAEREAARQDRYDAFVDSIGGASGPSDGTAESAASTKDQASQVSDIPTTVGAGDGDTSPDAGLVQARYLVPPEPPPPPMGIRAAPPLDARGMAPVGPGVSGFFSDYDYNPALGGYYTGLPAPLTFVTSTPSGWWDLADGSLVRSDEVQRIYAEQKRRISGQVDDPPPAHVRTVDNWKDGSVPLESQVQAGERELDPTCHPNGGWERDPGFWRNSRRSQMYQAQVTRAPGLDYVVRNPGERPVKFDGCAVWDPQHPLLEAKGPGYDSIVHWGLKSGFYGNIMKGIVDQAGRQSRAAPQQRIEWHYAEPNAFEFFNDATWPDQPPIVLKRDAAH